MGQNRAIAALAFATGFALAHGWAMSTYTPIVEATGRFFIIALAETLLAVVAFALAGHSSTAQPGFASAATALLFGFAANAFTVGPMALAPPSGEQSLVVYFVAIAATSFVLGWAHIKIVRKVGNDT